MQKPAYLNFRMFGKVFDFETMPFHFHFEKPAVLSG